jgi:hypothetical protein
MADRDWGRIYEATKRQIISKRQMGQGIPAAESRAISEAIGQLDSQLKDMMASPMEYEIAPSELARRQSLVENLQKQMAIVPQGVGGFGQSGGGSGGGGGGSSAGVTNPMNHSDRGLMQRQKDVIRLQDDMVTDIGHGVDRLHVQATGIGEETKIHTRLLDDLEGHVDDTAGALTAESQRANEVREKAGGCAMYVCVAVEFLVLMILIVLVAM